MGRTSQSVPAPGTGPGEMAPALQLTEHGSALERRWHNSQEHQELPSVPSPGGTTYLWQGEEGPAFLRSSPISMEEGPSPCLSPASRARLEFWCLQGLRGLTSQQVQKLWSRCCPAQHRLCNIRADGRCLKLSLLKKKQIKGNRNHRIN